MNVPRDSYVECAQLARAAIKAANGSGLCKIDHRVLGAVLSFTALYSRKSARLYLGQLAAESFGVAEAEDWQAKRTREALRRLSDAEVVFSRWPRGRHPGSGPAYVVSLVPLEQAESDPEPQATSMGGIDPETEAPLAGSDLETRSDSAIESDPDPVRKVTPNLSGNEPAFQGPYREEDEKNYEEGEGQAVALEELATRAAAIVTWDTEQVPGLIKGLRSKRGRQVVDDVLEGILDKGAKFQRPRDLIDAVERNLPAVAVASPLDGIARGRAERDRLARLEPTVDGTCPDCDGPVDLMPNGVEYCPVCDTARQSERKATA